MRRKLRAQPGLPRDRTHAWRKGAMHQQLLSTSMRGTASASKLQFWRLQGGEERNPGSDLVHAPFQHRDAGDWAKQTYGLTQNRAALSSPVRSACQARGPSSMVQGSSSSAPDSGFARVREPAEPFPLARRSVGAMGSSGPPFRFLLWGRCSRDWARACGLAFPRHFSATNSLTAIDW